MNRSCATELAQFRQTLYQNLTNRADTVMELIDALCSSPAAQSMVELTLAPSFRRTYSTLFKVIEELTPETEREERWWQLVHIAYAQLWIARHVTSLLPRPWERNLPAMRTRHMSSTLVQRNLARIIRQLGTPAKAPIHRGYSRGRRPGAKLPPRPRHKVMVKRLLEANSP